MANSAQAPQAAPLSPPAPRKALPVIDPDRCTGCGRCVAVCPPHVLWLAVQGPHVWGPKRSELHDAEACTGCAKCAVICPFEAIQMQRLAGQTPGSTSE